LNITHKLKDMKTKFSKTKGGFSPTGSTNTAPLNTQLFKKGGKTKKPAPKGLSVEVTVSAGKPRRGKGLARSKFSRGNCPKGRRCGGGKLK